MFGVSAYRSKRYFWLVAGGWWLVAGASSFISRVNKTKPCLVPLLQCKNGGDCIARISQEQKLPEFRGHLNENRYSNGK